MKSIVDAQPLTRWAVFIYSTNYFAMPQIIYWGDAPYEVPEQFPEFGEWDWVECEPDTVQPTGDNLPEEF